jgi:hypothetical protein
MHLLFAKILKEQIICKFGIVKFILTYNGSEWMKKFDVIASHYPLKLLLALTCGVHLVNTIYEEYFVFPWMPQQYTKKSLVITYTIPMCWKLTKLLVHV